MGRKTFCLPSLASTFVAFVLLLLVTISVPLTFHASSPFYIVGATNLGGLRDITGNGANPDRNLTGLRAGLWGYCTKGANDTSYSYCSDNNHQYNFTLAPPAGQQDSAAYSSRQVKTSWTRGLVVAVVAFVFTIIGLILSVPPHLAVQLGAAIWLLLTLLLALIAFVIQIVFFIYVRQRIHDLNNKASISPGPAFYLTLISLPLLLFSALTVACGWQRERKGGSDSYEYGGGSSGLLARVKKPFGGRYGRKEASDAPATGNYPDQSLQDKDSIPLTSRQRVLDAFNKT
ncbi:unnamed protein product [Parajaminaea phylloscopi]